MRKIICDKCGMEVGVQSLEARINNPDILSSYVTIRDIDLCDSCTQDFINWLKEKPTGK